MLKDDKNFKVLKECRGNKNNQILLVEHVPTARRMILKLVSIKNLERQLNEVTIHKKLRHEFVIRLLDYDYNDKRIRMLIEHARFGDLFELLPQLPSLGEFNALKIFYKTVKAVEYLHSIGFAHRDIKPENILIGEKLQPKLADFGTTTAFSRIRKTVCGTYEYMAPEIFEQKTQSNKVDIWSLGILLYEMTHLTTPFPKSQLTKIRQIVSENKLKFKADINPNVKRLILSMLQLDPEKRPSCSEILDDVMFARFRSRSSCNPVLVLEPTSNETAFKQSSLKPACSLPDLNAAEFDQQKIDQQLLERKKMNDMKFNLATMQEIQVKQEAKNSTQSSLKFNSPTLQQKNKSTIEENYYSADKANPAMRDLNQTFKKKSKFTEVFNEDVDESQAKDQMICEKAECVQPSMNFAEKNYFNTSEVNRQKKDFPIQEAIGANFSQSEAPNTSVLGLSKNPNANHSNSQKEGFDSIKSFLAKATAKELSDSLENVEYEKLKEIQMLIAREMSKKQQDSRMVLESEVQPKQKQSKGFFQIFGSK